MITKKYVKVKTVFTPQVDSDLWLGYKTKKNAVSFPLKTFRLLNVSLGKDIIKRTIIQDL